MTYFLVPFKQIKFNCCRNIYI